MISEQISLIKENYTINKASLIDILKIHKLYINLSQQSKSTYHSKIYGYPNGIIWFLSQICMFLSNTPCIYLWRRAIPIYIYRHFVAKNKSGEVIGFVHFVLHGKDIRGRVRANVGAAIADKYQGLGIGSALFKEMIWYALEQDKIDILYLDVLDSNISAVKLYTKYGFKIKKTENGILKMECNLQGN